MNAQIGWALAVLGVAAGYWAYRWPGVVMAFSVIVFWLLLQFSRSLRVMRSAAGRPVGYIDGAVMLNAGLKPELTMMQIIVLTKSLGRRVDGDIDSDPEHWRWADPGGASVTLTLRGGKLESWRLARPDETPAA